MRGLLHNTHSLRVAAGEEIPKGAHMSSRKRTRQSQRERDWLESGTNGDKGRTGLRHLWAFTRQRVRRFLNGFDNKRLEEPAKVDVSVYGSPLPLNYGTFRHKCNIIWATKITPYIINNLSTDTVLDSTDFIAGGWKASWAVAVCKGPQGALLRVWFNKILIFDYTQSSTSGYVSHPNYANKLVFYKGDEIQTADPTMEAEEGAGNVPAYRGTCLIVFKDIPLGAFGDELPEVEAEVSSAETPNYTTYNV